MTERLRTPALALLFALGACAGRQTEIVTHPGEGVPTAQALLERAWASPTPRSVQGTTRMRIQTPGRNARFRGIIVVQAPGQVRAEILSLLGGPVAYLLASPREISLYSPYSDTHVTTEDPVGVLDRVAGQAVSSDDLVGLLLGQVPACVPRERGPLVPQGGTYAIQCMERGDVARTLVFDSQTWLLRSVTGRSTSAGTFQVLMDTHQDAGGYQLPHHIQLTAPALGLDAELNYEEIAVDQAVDPGLFVLAVPPGLTTHTFEELLDRREAATPPADGG